MHFSRSKKSLSCCYNPIELRKVTFNSPLVGGLNPTSVIASVRTATKVTFVANKHRRQISGLLPGYYNWWFSCILVRFSLKNAQKMMKMEKI